MRIIPFLKELGVSRFTFVDMWKKYDMVNFEYVPLNDRMILSDVQFPLCQIVSKETELNSPHDITRILIFQALSGKRTKSLHNASPESFVVVVDTDGFYLRDNQDKKPLIEDYDLTDNVAFYEKIFHNYFHITGEEPVLSTTETMNMQFHKMAIEQYKLTGIKPEKLSDLFDYEEIPPDSYAWNMLKDFANSRARLEFDVHIRECLRSWVENDVTHIVDNMMETLQKCQFDEDRIELWRKSKRSVNYTR